MMNSLNQIIGIIFTTIVVSFVWARFRFFKIGSTTPMRIAKFYDPAVLANVLLTYYLLLNNPLQLSGRILIGGLLLLTSFFFFWWAVKTVRDIGFALTEKIERLHIVGPFSIVRHPFYSSYCLAWLGTSVMFNSIALWITLVYLIAFYYQLATAEEIIILKSQYSREYQAYRQKVGMFLPRITKWKS